MQDLKKSENKNRTTFWLKCLDTASVGSQSASAAAAVSWSHAAAPTDNAVTGADAENMSHLEEAILLLTSLEEAFGKQPFRVTFCIRKREVA